MNSQRPNTSRTAYAAKGSFYGFVGKGASLLATFISRTVFIYVLGKYYLGVNGLYTEILSFLSFAELGFGSAMVFALYGPVARGEEEKVKELMYFYKWVYRIIALVILCFGLALMPFLQHIVRGAEGLTLFELRLYFFIFLLNTVTTYFVIYKYSYLNALQLTYITTNIETVTALVCVVIQLVALVVSRSFLVYLVSNTATLILSRAAIAHYLNSRYPLLKERPEHPLSRRERNKIFTEVKGLAVHQFSNVAVHSTTSIIISVAPTLGVAMVGAVSNYNMLMNAVNAIVIIVFNSVVAGFGNLAVTADKNRFMRVFDEANFINFWVYGFCTVCFFVLLPPFIQLWIGEDFLIDELSLALILVNFYFQGQCTIYNNARVAKGNFNMDKWWSLLQAIVNLVASFIGAFTIGLVGVFLGMVLSRLMFVVTRPCSTYRFLFGESPARYFRDLIAYGAAVLIAVFVSATVCSLLLHQITWLNLFAAALLCVLISNAIFLLLFHRSKNMAACLRRIEGLLKGRG